MRKGGESSNYARLHHGWYKNVDCHTIFTWPRQLYAYQNFTAEEHALAGPTLAPPIDMGYWGGTSQNLGWNDRVWGGRGADRPGRID